MTIDQASLKISRRRSREDRDGRFEERFVSVELEERSPLRFRGFAYFRGSPYEGGSSK